MSLHDYATPSVFAGRTRILTHDGIRALENLTNQAVKVLDGNRKWSTATVTECDSRKLSRIKFRRLNSELTVSSSPTHPWRRVLDREGTLADWVATSDLRVGDRFGLLHPRPIASQLRASPFGVAHGITFGDGSAFAPTVNGWRTASVVLHAEKRELLRFFPESHSTKLRLSLEGYAEDAVRVADLPMFFRSLPSLTEAPSYLYGWLAGYVATDASVSKPGDIVLTSARREHLEFVETICLRLGIATRPIHHVDRIGINQTAPSPLFGLGFVSATLGDDFLLRSKHRERFVKQKRSHPSRWAWTLDEAVADEELTGAFEVVVPSTHSFALEGYLFAADSLTAPFLETARRRCRPAAAAE